MNKILVTGADGFIGSHLTEILARNGDKVIALSQYNSFNNWGWLEDVDCMNDIDVITGDIRDSHLCKKITRNVDIIFHLAALIAIPYSYQAPESYIDTNVKGTLNICQAALENECQRIVHTSTSEVYGTAKYVPIDEKHPLQPQSPYSASKIGADAVAMSHFHAFQLPVIVARPFNTFGPRQSARAIIPSIITQIAGGQTKIKLGDLSPTRDLNYVTDTCRGMIQLAQCDGSVGKVINIGSNYEIAMKDLVNLIVEIMGAKVTIQTDPERLRPNDSEVFRLWCDNTRIKQLAGYQPEYSLREGLVKTIDWFTDPANLSKYKVGIYNV